MAIPVVWEAAAMVGRKRAGHGIASVWGGTSRSGASASDGHRPKWEQVEIRHRLGPHPERPLCGELDVAIGFLDRDDQEFVFFQRPQRYVQFIRKTLPRIRRCGLQFDAAIAYGHNTRSSNIKNRRDASFP